MTTQEIISRSWQEILESNLLHNRWGACDIRDENGEVLLLVDLPGARKEDISLRHQDRQIEIKASRNDSSQRFVHRSIALPGIDPDTIKAHLENGILEIRAQRQTSGKEIEISS